MVFDAIGKYIQSTRYRQIVEISSPAKGKGFCEKTKNTAPAVAKVQYQKQGSQEVALKGHECLQKLQGAKRSEVDEDVFRKTWRFNFQLRAFS